MSSNLNCSYMARSSLTYIPGFSVKFFLFSQFISFREDLWNFSQSEHIIGPGSHVEYPTGTKKRKFVEDHPRNIPAKFGSNWPSGFREEAYIDYHWTLWENVQMPSSQKLQIWLKPNCTWMFIGWSSTILWFFVSIWNSKWEHFPIGSNVNLCPAVADILDIRSA
jgi:hypothetical protein